MKVNLDALKEQLEKEIQAIEQKKAVLADQIKHVEAVSRLAGRLDSNSVEESEQQDSNLAPHVDSPSAEPEERLDEGIVPQQDQKVNGKAPEAPPGEGFEWAFQDDRG